MKTEFIIVKDGMGAMLNPPNDAEHKFHVKERKVSTRYTVGDMSLRHALTCDYVPASVKAEVEKLLALHKGELTEEWEHTCYNYFRNCYSKDGVSRNVNDNMVIDRTNSQPIEHHLAYMHIKTFFPDYKPNELLIHNNGDKGSWSSSKKE